MSTEEYAKQDALGLAALLKAGEIRPDELLELAISMAESLQPKINALTLPMYEQARQTLNSSQPKEPFFGVPYLLKDLLATYSGVPMSSGSRALRHWIPDYDTTSVERSKAAGLVIFGKTNTPEFGLMGTTEPDAFGATRNPWDLQLSPGGSSGGSAAAVAARIVPMASAGDGGGSIRIPAAYCGLFGLKPSRGRVPSGPKLGQAWYGATAEHALTRSVRDSAALLDCLQGQDDGAPYIIAPPDRPYLEETMLAAPSLKIGWTLQHPLGGQNDPEVEQALSQTASLLQSLGHQVENVSLPYEGQEVMEAYLALYFGDIGNTIEDIQLKTGKRARYRDVEPTTWTLYQVGKRTKALHFARSLNQWGNIGRRMGQFFRHYDLFLCPVVASPKLPIGTSKPSGALLAIIKLVNALGLGVLYKWSGIVEKVAYENLHQAPYTQVANLAGLPAMSVPLQQTKDGFPVGVQFMAPFGQEGRLFRLAAQLEQAQPWADRMPSIIREMEA